MKAFHGILPAAVTPFDDEERFVPSVFETLLGPSLCRGLPGFGTMTWFRAACYCGFAANFIDVIGWISQVVLEGSWTPLEICLPR